MGYDEKGLWRGAVLENVGFFSINFNSKFHINNSKQAARLQGLNPLYYLGMYNTTIYLTEKGFTRKKPKQKFKLEEFEALEENQTIEGGRV